jgi:hypothetical protein
MCGMRLQCGCRPALANLASREVLKQVEEEFQKLFEVVVPKKKKKKTEEELATEEQKVAIATKESAKEIEAGDPG